MRIATLNNSQGVFAGIEARQSEQTRLQNQLSTGLRVNAPGDDPVAAAQAELARSRLARIAQDQRTAQLSNTLMSAADGALSDGVTLLQQARERLVAAGNGTYSASERQALALELRGVRDSMVAVANARDGAGGYVFSGQGSAGQPMAGGATPGYDAVAGEQRMGEGGRFIGTVDGRAAFMTLPQGNGVFVTASASANSGSGWIDPGTVSDATKLTGHDYAISIGGAPGSLTYSVTDTTSGTTLVSNQSYAAGVSIDIDGQRVKVDGTPAAGDSFTVGPSGQQSVFATLDEAIATLEGPSTGNAYAEKLQRVQTTLDGALDGMIQMRNRVGQELRKVDDAQSAQAQESERVTGRQSDLRDLDFAQAISSIQTSQTSLQAALQVYASIGKTSLFQMLG